jgi:hypothetical protein
MSASGRLAAANLQGCAKSATAKTPEVRYGLSTMVDEFTVGSVAQHLQSLKTGGTVRSLQ